jgi:hypothetical protein
LESCLSSQALGDKPNASGEDTENNHDGAEKDRDLLLAQAHCRDRITDPPKPAKLKGKLGTPASCA